MFNLLQTPWLPVLRLQSGPGVISPVQLTEAWETDPVVALDWPRADFRVAGMEFLTGLLATAWPAQDANAWLDAWEAPPEPAVLEAAFAPFTHAFGLDGEGPRFMQDIEDFLSDAKPVERLLIEVPGESTVNDNTDLLVRRGQVVGLGRAAAAMALFTLQAWASEGGAGNFTGLRGGGPLTTFVLPSGSPALWHALWANVPLGVPAASADLARVFPWLAPTITSEGARVVTPGTSHPLQAWWGMPRRIRLDFTPCDPPRPCGLTGVPDTVEIMTWRQQRGVKYAMWGDAHPLTPRYRLKPGSEVLPVHPQLGGVGYRHWVGLAVRDGEGLRFPALATETWRGRRQDLREMLDPSSPPVWHDRLLTAGYDMKKMKARGFVESEMPLPGAADRAVQDRLDDLARRLVRGADIAAGLLRRAVREALFAPGASVKLDWEMLSAVREQLWEQTEPAFFSALEREAVRADDPSPEPAAWIGLLRRVATDLFDAAAPLSADGGALPKSDGGIRRLLRARRSLGLSLAGYGKEGGGLFDVLGLPPAERKPARKGRAA